MSIRTRWFSCLLVAMNVLALVTSGGCNRRPPLACDSPALLLPERLVASGESVSGSEATRRRLLRADEQHEWLSLHLDLANDTFGHGAPIAFRLIITNETNHPVVFRRPRLVMLGTSLQYHNDVGLQFVPSPGGRLPWSSPEMVDLRYQPPQAEEFTLLQPGQGCMVDLQWEWNETLDFLLEPLPAGDYQMSVVMRGFYVGPSVLPEGDEYRDVGAWVGTTDTSNVVKLTVLPSP